MIIECPSCGRQIELDGFGLAVARESGVIVCTEYDCGETFDFIEPKQDAAMQAAPGG